VVGDRDRIDVDLAHALVTGLQAAGFEIHQVLNSDASANLRGHLDVALAEIDTAIRLIRLAAAGLESSGNPLPPS